MVRVASPGPPGPAGAPGPMGPTGGEHFIYSRNGIAAASWPIEHGLGRRVHVTVLSDSGEEVEADVQHSDLNNLTVSFSAPFSGVAVIG